MNYKNDLLEAIRLQEKHKLLFKGKLTFILMVSTELEAIGEMYKVEPNTSEKTFQPSPIKYLILFFLVGLPVFALYQLIRIASKFHWAYLYIALMLGLIVFLIYEGIFNPKKNYSIRLNFDGIYLNNEFYSWKDVKATGMLTIGSGRGEQRYFILALSDGSYRKYNMMFFLRFWGFSSALSTYIEYFKKQKIKKSAVNNSALYNMRC